MSRSAVGWVRGAAGAGLFLLLAVGLSADPHIRTGGIPSDITQSVTQRFHKGDHIINEGLAATVVGADISPIILSCQGGDVLEATDIRVIIPGTLPLTWKADIFPTVSAVIVGSPANPVNPGPPPAGIASPAGVGLAATFPDPGGAEKTIFLDVTGSFVPGNAFTLGNLKVLNVDTTAAATHIQMKTDVGQAIPYEDVAWWMVANDPSGVSFAGGQQILTPGTATQALGALTITESNTAPAALTPFNGSIWNDKDIRITIPSTVTGVTWNAGAISSLNAKIGASVTTEDAGRTVVIPVVDGSSNDFTQGESAVINGLTMNVTAAAPDQTFSMIVRLAGSTHYTAHFTMTNVCKVEGWPKLASQGPNPAVFAMGAAATPAGTFTITESSGAGAGSRKMKNGVNLDVTIPNTLNLLWGTAPVASIQAPAGTASVGVPAIQPGNKILRIPVTGDFSANQILTLTGATFAGFTGQNLTDQFLQLELDAPHAGFEAVDTRAIRIGRPSISSTNDDVFLIGGGAGTLNTITVTDDVNAVLGVNTQVRIHISSSSNLSFTGALPTLGGGFTGGAVSFEDANKTLVVTWKSAPVASATGTISNAAVSWPAAASFGNLELWMATVASTVITHTSPQNLIVGNLPTMASTLTQQFTVNDPDPTAHPLTITTDPGSFQLFQGGNSLQLIIPSALNLQWKNPQPGGFGMSGSAFTNGRMTGAINYPDSKTLEFPINLDWASGEVLTLTGLQFATVGAVSPPTGLQLRVRVGGPIAATDTNAKAIGAPILASFADQVFGDTDPATTMSPITITEHGVTPRILANSALRIRIPAGFNMTWDPTSTPILALGAGAGTLGVAPTFTDGNSVLNIPIGATGFSANQTLGITGARFVVSGTSTLSHLELEVNNSGVANVLDTKSILIGVRPTITAVTTDDTNGNGSIDRVYVTFSEAMDATGSQSVSSGLGFAFGPYNISTGSLDITKKILTLILAETGLPDTNAVPALTYTSTGPGAGDLKDFNDGLGPTAAIPGTTDGARPVVLGITVVDNNGDGRPDEAIVTFSEAITGPLLLSHWTMVDANGATDLLAGLTDSSLMLISGNTQIQFTLAGASGTMGTPRFQYRNIAPPLTDAALNAVATQTNNGSPVANAGTNQVVVPSLVTLDGSASSDPDGQPLVYDWSYLGGPVLLPQLMLTGTTTSKPTFLATAAGTYTFQLKISDFLVSQTAVTTVTVLNVAPVAYAGPDLTVINNGGGNLPLNALASSDANGDALTYQWSVLSGPAYVGQTSPAPVLTGFFLVDGLFQLELQVTDGAGAMSKDTMWVRVNSVGSNCPTADAGPDQIVPINTLVTLDGRNTSDTDGGALTFTWSGPLALNTAVQDQPTFIPTAPGVYTFTLSVTDLQGHGSIPSTVRVLAYNPANLPPLAVANKITLGTPAVGQTVTLDAAGSLDPEGKPLQYLWTQLRGARVALSDSSGPKPTFAATQPGTYEFELVVSDSVQYSLPCVVSFPITTAGGGPAHSASASLLSPAPVPPNGHVVSGLLQLTSTTAGAFIHTVWTQEAGPSVPIDVISASPSFTPGAGKRGVYRFTRTGWDAQGVVVRSPLAIVVDDDLTEIAPTAKAGADQTVTAGQLVQLDANLSTDNSPTATLIPFWVQIVGPPVSLSSSSSLTPTFTPTTPGTYLFALKVSDGAADSLTDFVQITVLPAPVKKASGSGGGCGSVGVDALLLVGLVAVGWRRRRA